MTWIAEFHEALNRLGQVVDRWAGQSEVTTPADPVAPTHAGPPASGPVSLATTYLGTPGTTIPGQAVAVSRYPLQVVDLRHVDTMLADVGILQPVFRPPAVGQLRIAGQWDTAVALQWSVDGGQTWLTGPTVTANAWTEWTVSVVPDDAVTFSVSATSGVSALRLLYWPDIL